MFRAIDHCGKIAVRMPVAGDKRDRPLDHFARSRARGGVERGQQEIGLAVPGEAGEADDLAFMRHELATVRLSLGANAHADPPGAVAGALSG